MAPNPFIELAQDPVGVLAWLGYLLLMLAVLAVALPWAVRKAVWLYARWEVDRGSDKWWGSWGRNNHGYVPPAGWLVQLFWVIVVLAIAAWALGTLVWMVGG